MPVSLVSPNIRGVLHCGHCPCQIVFPFSTLPPKPENQEMWPNQRDWLYFACPECRIASAYIECRNEALPTNQTTRYDDRMVIRISFLCEQGICRVPRQFHILADAQVTETTETELQDLLASGYWTGAGPCAHTIGISTNQKVSFDSIRGGSDLRGYNRNASFWRDF